MLTSFLINLLTTLNIVTDARRDFFSKSKKMVEEKGQEVQEQHEKRYGFWSQLLYEVKELKL